MVRKLLATAAGAAIFLAIADDAAADVGSRLRRVAEAYEDVFAQYPKAYSCELRSPELVASLDERGRRAWGSGHIRMTQGPEGLRLTAENLAKPEAAPWFNIALGIWQLKLGVELQVLQARLPEFFLATALGAVLRYRGFEEQQGRFLRFGLRSRNEEDQIREASFLVEDGHALRELRIENRDGSSLAAKIGNLPAPGAGDRLLVSEIEAELTKPTGEVEVWSASLGYAPVGDRVLFEHIVLRVSDAEGKLIRRRPKDINPISYYFSNCRILATPRPETDRLGTD